MMAPSGSWLRACGPLLGIAVALAASPDGPAAAAPSRAQSDSQRTLRRARDAQADFEGTRRFNLPTAFGHADGACDARVGRFCYWSEGGDRSTHAPPPPPSEPERIRRARERLLHTLDSVAALLPGDPWIAGQRVRYLVEGGRSADALAAARACRADVWWCEALAGFALHVAGAYAPADSVYRAVLRDMPPEQRCRWRDVSVLLDGELGRRYRGLRCDQREPFEERLWWLAQPLYAVRGNERRTEHFARATLARIAQDARSTYGVSWGDDLRELTLRYGWPLYWTQEPSGWALGSGGAVTGHGAEPDVHFLPDARRFVDPVNSLAEDWVPDPRPARERYAPAYAFAVAPLAHQVALFRRGDSCLVVAAYDASRDTALARTPVTAALVLARDERGEPEIERRDVAGSADEIVAKTACAPALLSLEVTSMGGRRAARARFGVRPPPAPAGGVSVSDIVLFDPPDSLPTELAGILVYVRGSGSVRADARVGLFWEIYGLDAAGEPLTTAVSVTPAHAGWLRRATESLGLAARRGSVRLEWRELPQVRGAMAGRALALDLTGLSAGRYRIEVALEAAGDRRAVANREIEVERR
jgi:hypothetical protein